MSKLFNLSLGLLLQLYSIHFIFMLCTVLLLCCVTTLRELQRVERLCRAKKTSLLSARVDFYFERKIKEKKTFNAEFLLFFRSLTYKTHSTTPSAQLSASSLTLYFQRFFYYANRETYKLHIASLSAESDEREPLKFTAIQAAKKFLFIN